MREHLRHNVVAYLALFVALGGTSAIAASTVTSSDIRDNTIRGRDIRTGQVAGSDLRDGSATGADVADESLGGADVGPESLTGEDVTGLTGADVLDQSIGGEKIDPATKVPNADMLDGHGSTRYGVGLQMGVARDLQTDGPHIRFPAGVTTDADDALAVAPEVLELRDFTAVAHDLEPGETVEVELVGSSSGSLCELTSTAAKCHLPSNDQRSIPGQGEWGLRFTTAGGLDASDHVSFSYRSVR